MHSARSLCADLATPAATRKLLRDWAAQLLKQFAPWACPLSLATSTTAFLAPVSYAAVQVINAMFDLLAHREKLRQARTGWRSMG
jgi:hypothetical protein